MLSLIITIDGPAGAGKGTLARILAKIYHLAHLDTGLLYRGVALKMFKEGCDVSDQEAAVRIASSLSINDLEDPSLRDEKTGNLASHVATIPRVREVLLNLQRNFAKNPPEGSLGVVLDGRDIGRLVFPEAPCKIYVTASPEVRATRRLKELHQKEINSIYETVLEDIKARDARDRERKFSPLLPAEDAFIIDTSKLGIDEVVKKACFFVDSTYPDAKKTVASPHE